MPCICVSLCKLWIVNFQRQNTGTQHNKQKLDSTQDFTSRNGKIRLNIHISIDLNRINKWEISMLCFFFLLFVHFVCGGFSDFITWDMRVFASSMLLAVFPFSLGDHAWPKKQKTNERTNENVIFTVRITVCNIVLFLLCVHVIHECCVLCVCVAV